MTSTLKGGCFCGQVRYDIDAGEYTTANCHCSMCRRTSGAPYVTWLVVPESAFRYTTREPKTLQSSSDGTRYFCEDCGTPVACRNTTHPGIIDVTVGSLDNPESCKPGLQIFDDTRLPWVQDDNPVYKP